MEKMKAGRRGLQDGVGMMGASEEAVWLEQQTGDLQMSKNSVFALVRWESHRRDLEVGVES